MNKFLIPVIASILILGSVGLSQDVFAVGSMSFLHPNDGDTVKGKKIAIVTNLSGWESGEYVIQLTAKNIADPNNSHTQGWFTNDKTPPNPSSPNPITLLKGVTSENPNGQVVILINTTDFLIPDNTYQIQFTFKEIANPANQITRSVNLTFN